VLYNPLALLNLKIRTKESSARHCMIRSDCLCYGTTDDADALAHVTIVTVDQTLTLFAVIAESPLIIVTLTS
jgi:hypothetical protein